MDEHNTVRLSQLAGDFVVRLRRFPALIIGNQQILPADISRFSLLFALSGFSSATVWPGPLASLNQGITLSTTVPFQIKYPDFGPVLGHAWFAFDGFGGAAIDIIEVCYKPGGNT